MARMYFIWGVSVFGQFTLMVAAILTALFIWDRWPNKRR